MELDISLWLSLGASNDEKIGDNDWYSCSKERKAEKRKDYNIEHLPGGGTPLVNERLGSWGREAQQ